MNLNELIASGLLERYVLGSCTAEEVVMIQSLCANHPELIREIEAIEEGLVSFANQVSPELDSELKQKTENQLEFKVTEPETKIVSLKDPNEKIKLYRFALAACLVLFCTSFFL